MFLMKYLFDINTVDLTWDHISYHMCKCFIWGTLLWPMAMLKQRNIMKTDSFQDQATYIESNLGMQVKVLALSYYLAWPHGFLETAKAL